MSCATSAPDRSRRALLPFAVASVPRFDLLTHRLVSRRLTLRGLYHLLRHRRMLRDELTVAPKAPLMWRGRFVIIEVVEREVKLKARPRSVLLRILVGCCESAIGAAPRRG